jgi:hypothetical protein
MTTTTLPPLVEFYCKHWPDYLADTLARLTRLDELETQELTLIQDCFTDWDYYRNIFDPRKDHVMRDINSNARDMIYRLVKIAIETFSPPDWKLAIDPNPYIKSHLNLDALCGDSEMPLDRRYAAFNPLAVWAALEADFSGASGQQAAYSQMAEWLVASFRLRPGQVIAMKANHIILNMPLYLGKESHKLDTRSSRQIRHTLMALAGFLSWASPDTAVADLRLSICEVSRPGHEIRSRQTIKLTEGLSVVTYQNRWECRLAKSFGEPLQLFVGLYGETVITPLPMQSAA